MSIIGNIYDKTYGRLCGEAPYERLWHFQWLAVKDLHRDLREILSHSQGRVLDVGCGSKPYLDWFKLVDEYVGADIYKGPKVDLIIEPGKPWALMSSYYDVILCTQVLEHSSDIDHVLSEILRVLKPGGKVILSVPFCYNEHGSPYDFRRLSVNGVRELFSSNYEILEIRSQGGIGSTVGILILNWIDATLNRNLITRIFKGLLLPLWLLASFSINLFGLLMDNVDNTGAFYGNVLLTAKKTCE